MTTLRLGTRGSRLALVQADMVRDALAAHGVHGEAVVVRTTGDVKRDAPIADLGRIGVFTKELDDAVRAGDVDVAVHSLKDVPTIERDGLPVVAVLPRDAPGDALVGAASLEALPEGATLGTSSLRRRAQVLRARPDMNVVPVRGNVPTRIRKVDDGTVDAVLLSWAGLRRLGLDDVGTPLDPWRFPHAPGQGVVAVVAAEGSSAADVAARVNDADTLVAVEVERAIMAGLGGGCLLPLGVYADVTPGGVDVVVQVLDADGRESLEFRRRLPKDEAMARVADVVRALLDDGADRILRTAARL